MAIKTNHFYSVQLSQRIWRLSGFVEGNLILHEFSGPDCDTTPHLYHEACIIGRDPLRCDFVVSHPTVSRVHAELKYIPEKGVGIRDLGSSNGTYVGEQCIETEHFILGVGQQIRFGDISLTLSYPR